MPAPRPTYHSCLGRRFSILGLDTQSTACTYSFMLIHPGDTGGRIPHISMEHARFFQRYLDGNKFYVSKLHIGLGDPLLLPV
jgi:hypothetical protein